MNDQNKTVFKYLQCIEVLSDGDRPARGNWHFRSDFDQARIVEELGYIIITMIVYLAAERCWDCGQKQAHHPGCSSRAAARLRGETRHG
jgi:hypothetical protein